MYVSVKLNSGLGNRFFQVAAMLGYAERYGHTAVFVREWIADNPSHPGPFGITAFFPEIPVLERLEGPWTSIQMAEADGLRYVPLDRVDGNVCLEGCFQSEQYFPTRWIVPALLSDWVGGHMIPFETAAFLHVRRGDYLNPLCAHHRVDLADYIRRSLALYPAGTVFVVCSDDIAWCKSSLPGLYADIVSSDKWRWFDGSDYDTLAVMMRCARGGICANSTFSWWGAYLGSRELVCMPAVWGYLPMPVAVDIWPGWAVRLPV